MIDLYPHLTGKLWKGIMLIALRQASLYQLEHHQIGQSCPGAEGYFVPRPQKNIYAHSPFAHASICSSTQGSKHTSWSSTILLTYAAHSKFTRSLPPFWCNQIRQTGMEGIFHEEWCDKVKWGRKQMFFIRKKTGRGYNQVLLDRGGHMLDITWTKKGWKPPCWYGMLEALAGKASGGKTRGQQRAPTASWGWSSRVLGMHHTGNCIGTNCHATSKSSMGWEWVPQIVSPIVEMTQMCLVSVFTLNNLLWLETQAQQGPHNCKDWLSWEAATGERNPVGPLTKKAYPTLD